MRSDQAIVRSLKITGTTRSLVAAIAGAIALNSTVAIGYVGVAGEAVMLFVVFASLGLGSFAMSTDIYSRSSQTVANLRSIGATSKSISWSLASAMITYGVAGAAAGGAAGGAFGWAAGAGGGISILTDVVAVIVASAGGVAAGFYAGGRAAWRS